MVCNVCGYLQDQAGKRGSPYSIEEYSVLVYKFATYVLPGYHHVIHGHSPLVLIYL